MSANNVLGLDIGQKRIGIARANTVAKIPEALCTLQNDDYFTDKLTNLITEYEIDELIVGLPRNMSGQETQQSEYIRRFVDEVITPIGKPILFVDETLSTVVAQARLNDAKNSKGIDAMAATIILEDYLKTI